ncbi:MAG TPA: class I SAM-dependent methyltransferase, partial [Lacibacter sp.]|nr:class I SAM-dependent methyltransferase [Lacibacter sp.]
WGLTVGLYTLWHEWRGEIRYGIHTTSAHAVDGFTLKGPHRHLATEYMPVNYPLLEDLLDHLPSATRLGRFTDLGCGKGRALCVAAAKGFHQLTGVDFAREMVDAARSNLETIAPGLTPPPQFDLRWADAATFRLPDDTPCLFLFNPFEKELMQQVADRLFDRLPLLQQPLYIVYASPRHQEVFAQLGYEVLYRTTKINRLEGVILGKRNANGTLP